MPDVKYKNSQTLKGLSESVLAGQSILDIFVLQDILDAEDADKLKAHFKTSREIEDFLVKNRLVTKETINKAYSILLKMPYISLSNVQIPESAKAALPKKVAQKFGVIPFNVSNNLIRLAVSRPADLLVRYPVSLAKFFEDRSYGVELFVTGEVDFDEAIKQYDPRKSSAPLVKQGSLPVVYLRNQVIDDRYLKKLPRDFVERYRLVIFGQNDADEYLVGCETPDSSVTRKILEFLKKENGINLEAFATSADDIRYALESYDKPVNQRPKRDLGQEKTVANDVKDQSGKSASFKGMLDSILSNRKPSEPEITFDERPDFAKFMPRDDTDKAPGENPVDETPSPKKSEPEDSSAPEEAVSVQAEAGKPTAIKVVSDEDDNLFKKDNVSGGQEKNAEVGVEKKPEEKRLVETSAPSRVSLETKDIGLLLGGTEVNEISILDKIVKEGYVPKIVAAVIDFGLHSKASDVHLEPGSKHLRLRYRVDGVLQEAIKMPLNFHPPIIARIKILSKLKIDESRIPQDGRFDLVFKGREVDVRVSMLPTVNGEKVVMRVLDKDQGPLSLEDLGMQGSALEMTLKAIKQPWGIILSTGPTGSGKSTTLYAILNRVSVPGVNIVTLEDPVEYEIPGINQCQVKPEIGFTFASGLRSVLRQDPNIIMVGEIRDAETAGMATHAALTGHLVLSTLHTNDTANSLPRLINMGVESFLITSSINLVIAQRLIRRVCSFCKEEVKVPQKLLEEIRADLAKISPKNTQDLARIPKELKFYYGKGCSHCTNGYKGRAGIFEVMSMNPEIEEMAASKRPADEIKVVAVRDGMITMRQDGFMKALQGITTLDEVLQATQES
ncbi:MAG: ATPase, T2SS/T4P/T4SS family [Patescibacteria group bacterium]|jgi:type IV pilus assembly protein PilB